MEGGIYFVLIAGGAFLLYTQLSHSRGTNDIHERDLPREDVTENHEPEVHKKESKTIEPPLPGHRLVKHRGPLSHLPADWTVFNFNPHNVKPRQIKEQPIPEANTRTIGFISKHVPQYHQRHFGIRRRF